ncbi:MAG: hypothetical protein JWO31_784 [Phycisphaerales bacterium]|nr:hypothetical protein [Phycisphaerales bacterium]
MFDLILPSYAFAPTYVHKLVDDVPDERWCEQPVAGVALNHAAFTVGHLAWVHDSVTQMIGGTPDLPAEWKPLFATGAKPLPDRSAYPPRDALLAAFDAAHAKLGSVVLTADPAALAAPAPERMQKRFPTVGAMLAGLMSMHYGSHIGQLSAWRRAIGMPSVF